MSETSAEWRPVLGFEGLYEVSDWGSVRSVAGGRKLGRIIRTKLRRGYLRVSLYRNGQHGRDVHRLVAEAFLGPCPEGMECAHLNGIKTDCRATNLAWVTRSENHGHKALHGTAQRGERNPHAKLTDKQAENIRIWARLGRPTADIASIFGVSTSTVRDVVSGRRWKHVA